jgi:CRP-like cAMP-binding protein
MLTQVERVMILRSADLLKEVEPRHLVGLADVAREVEILEGDNLYKEDDLSDALYIVVEGRIRLSTDGRTTSEVGPGEAFGTWSLVDDSERGHSADCIEDGLTLALHREEFYDMAAGDLSLLKGVVRLLAKRLRALVIERPDEARVEGEGVEKTEANVEAETAAAVVVAAAAEAANGGGKPAAAKPSAAKPSAAARKS